MSDGSIRWNARSASKHGISEEDARFVVLRATTYLQKADEDFRMVWGMAPECKKPIEVGIVPAWPEGMDPEGDPVMWVIVHAMEAREPLKTRTLLEQERKSKEV